MMVVEKPEVYKQKFTLSATGIYSAPNRLSLRDFPLVDPEEALEILLLQS
jgi:hypothetical protein